MSEARVTVDRDVEVEFPDVYEIVHDVVYSVDEIRKGRRAHEIVERLADAGLLALTEPPKPVVDRDAVRKAVEDNLCEWYSPDGFNSVLEAITDAVMALIEGRQG